MMAFFSLVLKSSLLKNLLDDLRVQNSHFDGGGEGEGG